MDFLRFVLVRITLSLIGGIVVAHYVNLSVFLWATLCVAALLTALIWQHVQPKGFSFGVAAILALHAFALGGFVKTTNRQLEPNHYARLLNDNLSTADLVIRERLRSTAKGRRFVADVKTFNGNSTKGKVLLYCTNADDLPIGTRLEITGDFTPHHTAVNPGQFDYGRYLREKKIYAKCYPKAIKVKSVEPSLRQKADAIRVYLISKLRQSGFNENELQVFAALMLGQQHDIEPETLKNYQFAGAVHILSVSGLHVGFVVILLRFLLNPVPKTRKGSVARLLLTVMALWAFAILAGLAPSVVRSATMFSILAVGMHLRRSTNPLHTLVASLFILLVIDPDYLFDVGFQLSYAALGFILWLQPLFDRLWTPSGKITRYVWGIVTVSLAAQLGTLPLSLYYFHQFPGLFLLTNLAVIPMVGTIMAIGLAACLVVLCGFSFKPLFALSEWSIRLLNIVMEKIAEADAFVFQDIPFHFAATIAVYLLMGAWLGWLSKPHFVRLAAACFLTILFQCGWLYWRHNAASQAEFIVFQSKTPTVAIRQHRHITWFGAEDSITRKNFERQFYRVDTKVAPMQNLLSFDGTRIFVLDSETGLMPAIKPDALLVTRSPKINPERAISLYQPKLVIVDRSTSGWIKNLWKRECLKQKIPFHSTYEKGSYTMKKRLLLP